MRLTAPPLPAASRPSNRMTNFRPVALIQYCILTSSICSSTSLASYRSLFNFLVGLVGADFSPFIDFFRSFLPTIGSPPLKKRAFTAAAEAKRRCTLLLPDGFGPPPGRRPVPRSAEPWPDPIPFHALLL